MASEEVKYPEESRLGGVIGFSLKDDQKEQAFASRGGIKAGGGGAFDLQEQLLPAQHQVTEEKAGLVGLQKQDIGETGAILDGAGGSGTIVENESGDANRNASLASLIQPSALKAQKGELEHVPSPEVTTLHIEPQVVRIHKAPSSSGSSSGGGIGASQPSEHSAVSTSSSSSIGASEDNAVERTPSPREPMLRSRLKRRGSSGDPLPSSTADASSSHWSQFEEIISERAAPQIAKAKELYNLWKQEENRIIGGGSLSDSSPEAKQQSHESKLAGARQMFYGLKDAAQSTFEESVKPQLNKAKEFIEHTEAGLLNATPRARQQRKSRDTQTQAHDVLHRVSDIWAGRDSAVRSRFQSVARLINQYNLDVPAMVVGTLLLLWISVAFIMWIAHVPDQHRHTVDGPSQNVQLPNTYDYMRMHYNELNDRMADRLDDWRHKGGEHMRRMGDRIPSDWDSARDSIPALEAVRIRPQQHMGYGYGRVHDSDSRSGGSSFGMKAMDRLSHLQDAIPSMPSMGDIGLRMSDRIAHMRDAMPSWSGMRDSMPSSRDAGLKASDRMGHIKDAMPSMRGGRGDWQQNDDRDDYSSYDDFGSYGDSRASSRGGMDTGDMGLKAKDRLSHLSDSLPSMDGLKSKLSGMKDSIIDMKDSIVDSLPSIPDAVRGTMGVASDQNIDLWQLNHQHDSQQRGYEADEPDAPPHWHTAPESRSRQARGRDQGDIDDEPNAPPHQHTQERSSRQLNQQQQQQQGQQYRSQQGQQYRSQQREQGYQREQDYQQQQRQQYGSRQQQYHPQHIDQQQQAGSQQRDQQARQQWQQQEADHNRAQQALQERINQQHSARAQSNQQPIVQQQSPEAAQRNAQQAVQGAPIAHPGPHQLRTERDGPAPGNNYPMNAQQQQQQGQQPNIQQAQGQQPKAAQAPITPQQNLANADRAGQPAQSGQPASAASQPVTPGTVQQPTTPGTVPQQHQAQPQPPATPGTVQQSATPGTVGTHTPGTVPHTPGTVPHTPGTVPPQ